jgi:ATP-dependent Lon protease
MPDRNQKDMIDVPQQAKDEMEFFYVKRIDELLPLALTELPEKYGQAPLPTPAVIVTPPTTTPPTTTPPPTA